MLPQVVVPQFLGNKKSLYDLLRNPIYIGKVRHHDKPYDGVHAPIVDIAPSSGSVSSSETIGSTVGR
jgi:hypothetical protein